MIQRIVTFFGSWQGYAVCFAVAFAIGFGGASKIQSLRKAAAETKTITRTVYREREQADVTASVESKAVAAQVEIRTITRTIVEKVPVYVTAEADAACVVPRGAVVLLNAAAAGDPLPKSASEPDAAAANAEASGVALSRLVEVTAENYGSYQSVARQLTDLQDWIRQQQAVTNRR